MPIHPVATYSNRRLEPYIHAEDARLMAVSMEPAALGTTEEYARGTVLGQVAATGHFGEYDGAAIDGRDTARAILAYDVSVDDAGNITFTETAGQAGNERGEVYQAVPAWYRGVFDVDDLTGLDAGAVADLGRCVAGDHTAGILAIP